VAAVIAAAYSAISFRFFFITPGVVAALGAALLVAASFG